VTNHLDRVRAADAVSAPRRSGPARHITVRLNGDDRKLASGHTLASLLTELGIRPGTVVVEHILEIARRDSYRDTSIQEGDRIELVHFVGGG